MIKNKFENFLMDYPNKFKIVPSYAEIRGLLNINKLKLGYEKLLDYPKIFNTFCGIAKNKDSNNETHKARHTSNEPRQKCRGR